jgi:hypothetical protein
MSSILQDKLRAYEVAPPATTWDKIAAELDELPLNLEFPNKLYESLEAPPAAAWAAISSSLDELQTIPQYPVTLYNLETTPPAGVWSRITAGLDNAATPVRRMYSPIWKYAAAAVILAAVAFGGIRLLNSNSGTKDQPAATELASTKGPEKNTRVADPVITPVAPITDEQRNENALEESKHTYASLSNAERQQKIANSEIRVAPVSRLSSTHNLTPQTTYRDPACTDLAAPVYASVNDQIDMANRYVMLITPDGNIIRISRKLGSMVCCVSGQEQDQQCADQLKKWRQRIADAPMAPSAGNFMGIVDLLHTLKDNSL